MGFFFSQELGKKPSKQQRSISSLNKIGCAACPLNHAKVKTPKMRPTLASSEGGIYFLGEAPGVKEDEIGRPFVGPSGSLLRYCLSNRIQETLCSFDNIVRDRPSADNRDPTLTEIECCRSLVIRSIEQTKPKIIVGLGAHAQQWMLGSSDQTGMRGRVFAVTVGSHKCWFLPTYHPARVLHSASEQAKRQGRRKRSDDEEYLVTTFFGRTFKLDIEKALTYVNLPPPEIEEESDLRRKVNVINDFSTLVDLLSKAKDAPVKAIDIETNALRPYSPSAVILTVAISVGSIHFAFPLDHRLAKWSSVERKSILNLLKAILIDDTIKVAHNCFSGETEIITDKGLRKLRDLSGERVKVWTEKGWNEAEINHFGKQKLVRLTVVPYNRSTSKIRHEIHVTESHNWIVERKVWVREKKKYVWKRFENFIPTSQLTSSNKIIASIPNTREVNTYSKAFIHGLIFADGALIKNRAEPGHYPHNIRLCGWKSKFYDRFEKTTQPKSANGDYVCNWYVSDINNKELPPDDSSIEYIQDFIEGWQLLDGSKAPGYKARLVGTTNENAAAWLIRHAPLAGWYVTGIVEKVIASGYSPEPKPFWNITISKDENMAWTVKSIVNIGEQDVYCATVPQTSAFSLGQGIYTGNCPFECEWFIHYFGKEIINHVAWECTQLQAHFLDERRGAGQSGDDETRRATYQSLDFLVRLCFGLHYKAHFKLDRKNIANADLNETLIYNATDARLTLKLWHRQRELLRTEGLYNAYISAVPRQCTVAIMQYLGMPVNQVTVKRLQKKLDDEIAVLEAEIEMLDVVKQYKKDKKEFNPLGDDAVVVFRDYLKCKEIHIKDGDKTRVSIDKRVLEKIDHPLANLIVKLRNRTKMKSTYVDGLELNKGKYIFSDGNLHCNFNTTFTETGRTSADFPNMQNFPHRSDPWVREQIEAPEGYVIIAADYGQLEACAAAMISQDKTFIKYLWEDFDTHMAWAIKIANKIGKDISDHKTAKAFRGDVKGGFVFASFYGASAHKVATTLGIEENLAEEFQEELWETFSGYRSWQLKTLKEYRDKGYVETPTGRRRHHPLTSNELLNAPIQSFASDVVIDTMNSLSYIAATENKWHLHPRLNVHDDLSFIVPLKGVETSIETIYKTMLTPSIMELIPEKARVPLSVTVSIGKDWFHMDEVSKFWSHKDI